MSKFKNAPLLEVIFELRWKITNKDDLQKNQYLFGDLYSVLKEEFPIREALVPPEVPIDVLINKPVHRFRTSTSGYPLLQVGPGLITLNATDDEYYWEDYFNLCKTVTEKFFKIYPKGQGESFSPNLIYMDFFKLDIKTENVLTFIESNLHFNIRQDFLPNDQLPVNLNWGISYPVNQLGTSSVNINTGRKGNQEEGIILQTIINGPEFITTESIFNWLHQSHDYSSDLFKEMTKGKLYESFKS